MQYTSIYSQSQVSYYSDFLVRLAWVVEILAVAIGLTISVVMGLATYNSFEQSGGAGFVEGTAAILVTALPFILIAVVELCKIPLVFAFMAVKNVFWRSLFLIFVLFLCLITFETMFNGFERFWVEKIRVNATFDLVGITMTQAELISVCTFLSGVALWAWTTKHN